MAKIEFSLEYWRAYDVRVLNELLEYNPETGDLVWKPRSLKWFETESSWKIWNAKYPGKVAGSILANGYRQIKIFYEKCYAHRIIWAMQTGVWLLGKCEDELIDHINQDRSDNRWSNLRQATDQENKKNHTRQANNTSGVTGVHQNKQTGRWVAYIEHDGRRIHLGYFATREEAAAARKAADIKYGYHPNHGSEKKAA